MAHCDHTCDCDRIRLAGIQRAIPEALEHAAGCRALPPCKDSVHAEANVVAFAARYGISLLGADIVTTDSPCLSCSQLLVNTGVIRVLYGQEYRITDGLELLASAGIVVEQFV
jgi:deoxycytidylate deaminase